MRFFTGLVLIFLTMGAAHAGPATDKAQIGKTLNCGYVPYEPALVKDAKTDTWSGFDADFIKAAAARMHVTTQFASETNWGQLFEDLKARKFDMLCSTSWVNAEKAKYALYTKPLYYQPVLMIVRADDKRFDGKPDAANDPKVKFVALDGDAPVSIIHSDFPKAELMTLPQIQSYNDTFLTVATGKADALIGDASAFGLFNASNPGKLRMINTSKPIRIFPTTFVVASDEIQLWHAFNAAIDEMALDGTLEKLMRPYVKYPHAYYPVGRDGKFIVTDKVGTKK